MVFVIALKDRNTALEERILQLRIKRHLKLAVAESEGRKSDCDFSELEKKYSERQNAIAPTNIFDKNGYLTQNFAGHVVRHEDLDSFSYVKLLKESVGNCAVSAFLAQELYADKTGKNLEILWLNQKNDDVDHVVLYDRSKKAMYSFALGKFLTKNVAELPRHDVVTEKMMIQYCHMVGKKIREGKL